VGYISQSVCNNLFICVTLDESVDLLLQLQNPADSLCAEFLAHAETHLGEELTVLEGLQDQVVSPISKISENLKMCFTAFFEVV